MLRSIAPSAPRMRRPAPPMNAETLRLAADHAVGAMKLLANVDRMLLLCQLSQQEMCVSDMAVQLDIHQPTLSQQLAVLRSEGVVSTRREGKHVYYRVCDTNMLSILNLLYQLYCTKDVS